MATQLVGNCIVFHIAFVGPVQTGKTTFIRRWERSQHIGNAEAGRIYQSGAKNTSNNSGSSSITKNNNEIIDSNINTKNSDNLIKRKISIRFAETSPEKKLGDRRHSQNIDGCINDNDENSSEAVDDPFSNLSPFHTNAEISKRVKQSRNNNNNSDANDDGDENEHEQQQLTRRGTGVFNSSNNFRKNRMNSNATNSTEKDDQNIINNNDGNNNDDDDDDDAFQEVASDNGGSSRKTSRSESFANTLTKDLERRNSNAMLMHLINNNTNNDGSGRSSPLHRRESVRTLNRRASLMIQLQYKELGKNIDDVDEVDAENDAKRNGEPSETSQQSDSIKDNNNNNNNIARNNSSPFFLASPLNNVNNNTIDIPFSSPDQIVAGGRKSSLVNLLRRTSTGSTPNNLGNNNNNNNNNQNLILSEGTGSLRSSFSFPSNSYASGNSGSNSKNNNNNNSNNKNGGGSDELTTQSTMIIAAREAAEQMQRIDDAIEADEAYKRWWKEQAEKKKQRKQLRKLLKRQQNCDDSTSNNNDRRTAASLSATHTHSPVDDDPHHHPPNRSNTGLPHAKNHKINLDSAARKDKAMEKEFDIVTLIRRKSGIFNETNSYYDMVPSPSPFSTTLNKSGNRTSSFLDKTVANNYEPTIYSNVVHTVASIPDCATAAVHRMFLYDTPGTMDRFSTPTALLSGKSISFRLNGAVVCVDGDVDFINSRNDNNSKMVTKNDKKRSRDDDDDDDDTDIKFVVDDDDDDDVDVDENENSTTSSPRHDKLRTKPETAKQIKKLMDLCEKFGIPVLVIYRGGAIPDDFPRRDDPRVMFVSCDKNDFIQSSKAFTKFLSQLHAIELRAKKLEVRRVELQKEQILEHIKRPKILIPTMRRFKLETNLYAHNDFVSPVLELQQQQQQQNLILDHQQQPSNNNTQNINTNIIALPPIMVALIGAAASGKSTLLSSLVDDFVLSHYEPTTRLETGSCAITSAEGWKRNVVLLEGPIHDVFTRRPHIGVIFVDASSLGATVEAAACINEIGSLYQLPKCLCIVITKQSLDDFVSLDEVSAWAGDLGAYMGGYLDTRSKRANEEFFLSLMASYLHELEMDEQRVRREIQLAVSIPEASAPSVTVCLHQGIDRIINSNNNASGRSCHGRVNTALLNRLRSRGGRNNYNSNNTNQRFMRSTNAASSPCWMIEESLQREHINDLSFLHSQQQQNFDKLSKLKDPLEDEKKRVLDARNSSSQQLSTKNNLQPEKSLDVFESLKILWKDQMTRQEQFNAASPERQNQVQANEISTSAISLYAKSRLQHVGAYRVIERQSRTFNLIRNACAAFPSTIQMAHKSKEIEEGDFSRSLKQKFDRLDTKASGFITTIQAEELLEQFDPAQVFSMPEELARVCARQPSAANAHGFVNFNQFCAAVCGVVERV